MPRCALAVMARYPSVGEVKTRLARSVGSARACALYRAFLHDIAARFAHQRRVLVWAFHPPERDFASVVGPEARCLPQVGQDLGERMHNCFRQLFTAGFERVLMIGGDAPHVRDEWLDEAEDRLDSADIVLGPAADGGYYLIALQRPHDVFGGVALSTARALSDTVAKADAAGLRVHLLPPSFDVDDAADVRRLYGLLVDAHYARLLPSTAAVLRRWR